MKMAEVFDVQNFKLQDEPKLDDQQNQKLKELRATQVAKLVESYKLSHKLVERMINDESTGILKYFEERPEGERFVNVHDCTLYATVSAYLATCNLFPEDIAKSVDIVRECVDYCQPKRKKWTLSSAMAQMLRMKPNYNSYTEEECQAELCYAGLMMIRGVLNFIRDNNFFTMITGSLRLKMAHQSFRLCDQIMKNRKFENKEIAEVFMQGTKFGMGVYNLVLSMIPKRILRILEFIGFTGDRAKGIQLLSEGSNSLDCLCVGGLMCYTFLTMYFLVLRYFLGNGSSEEELRHVKPFVDHYLTRYPNSAAVLYVKGRFVMLEGHLDEALTWLQKSVDKESERVTVQLFAIWELSVIYITRGEGRKASEMVRRMRLEVNVSKCIFAYVEAVYLLSADDVSQQDKDYAKELLQLTPDLMAEYCGKHIPFEKWVARKARLFFAQENFLFLPHYEALYVFNAFHFLRFSPHLLQHIIQQADQFIIDIQSRKDWQYYTDNHCLALFLKGLSLKYLGKSEDAYSCFQQVLDRENDILSEVYVVMCSHLEAAIIDYERDNLEGASKHLKSAKKLRMFWVEFRIHQVKDLVEAKLKSKSEDD